MKNILVPIGSNENALNTLQYAIDFSKEIDLEIARGGLQNSLNDGNPDLDVRVLKSLEGPISI